MNIKERIDWKSLNDVDKELLKLQNTHPDLRISCDGIIQCEKYESADPRIMWILKQDIDHGEDDYAKKVIEHMDGRIAGSPTWRKLAYVSHGLMTADRDFEKIKAEKKTNKCEESLLAVAIVEANKEMGDSKSPSGIILDGFEKYKQLISCQITASKPDVVIVTMGEELKLIVESAYKFYTGEDKYVQGGHSKPKIANVAWSCVGDKIFLWAYHPSYRGVSDKDYFDGIVNAYDAAKNS